MLFVPFDNGSTLRRQNLLPICGFRVDPFQKGTDVQESKQKVTKVISLMKKQKI